MKSISFIGLGTMGQPMARNLLGKGYPLTVYNRTSEKTNDLVKQGATRAATPADAARGADIVFTMLGDDASIQEVYYGAFGIIEGLRPGMTVIDCSTVSPKMSRMLHQDLQSHYVSFLDAPVTGSKPAAEAGTLLFMVGGSPQVLNEHMDVFESLGSKVLHMGPPGAGSQTKLAHNTIVGINMAAFSEGLSIAAKAGIDPEKFAHIVLNGAANSRQAELKAERIMAGDFSVQFGLGLMLKDLNLASDLTASLNLPTPMLQSARTLFQMAGSKGLEDEDLSAVLKCYEEWSNTPVRSKSKKEHKEAVSGAERRRAKRIPLNIALRLSIYQWEQEGAFTGQTIEGTLVDLSDSGLMISSTFPLAREMFVVIHFPQEASLPPITGKIIRIEQHENTYRYGCMLSGLPLYTRKNLEHYIQEHQES